MLRLPFAVWVPLVLGLAVVACLFDHGFAAGWRSAKAGMLLAAPPVVAVWTAAGIQRLVWRTASSTVRFATVALVAPLLAVPLGGFVFAVQHVATYPQPFHFSFSEEGAYVLGWSGATALYLYLSDLRLYLPWTPLAFLALGMIWAAGRRR